MLDLEMFHSISFQMAEVLDLVPTGKSFWIYK